MNTWRIIQGDCRDVLATLRAGSVHTCVTSPPYFGLRDYGTDGQIGLEPTPDEFVAALVDVFREVRRVLRDDGTVWLNLGDSYANSAAWKPHTGEQAARSAQQYHAAGTMPTRAIPEGTKPKDLLGIPWMVAFALRADGWYLRADIIWSKPNPMPESVTDRPTKAHEYVFLLSKSPRYYFDGDAIREPHQDKQGLDRFAASGGSAAPSTGHQGWVDGGGFTMRPGGRDYNPAGRNKRSVWDVPEELWAQFVRWLDDQPEGSPADVWRVATQPYVGAHFATFPPKLIEPCILAGAPERACGECGAPWVRVVERTFHAHQKVLNVNPSAPRGMLGDQGNNRAADGHLPGHYDVQTLGFEPSCHHNDGSAAGVVLDPFAGAGTTGVVALRHGRSFVGIELSPAYAAMARWRIRDDSPLLNGAAEVDHPGTTTYEGDAA